MRRKVIGLLAGAAALGVAAVAVAAAPPPPPPTDQAPVTVTGQRPVLHRCGDRDEACIKTVIQRIWTDNPQQVKEWCVQETMRFTRQRAAMRALLGDGAIGPYNQDMPDAERELCDYGRTHKTP